MRIQYMFLMNFAYFCIMSGLSENKYCQIDNKPLKILLLGDASNFHNCLAQGLRRMGHDVTVASDGTTWMNTERDIDLSRPLPGKAGGMMLWLKIKSMLAKRFSGYDVVSVNGTCFATLRPKRLRAIFDFVLRHNRRVFVSVLGSDSHYVGTCTGKNPPLKYSEWEVYGKPTAYAIANQAEIAEWLLPELSELCYHIYERSEGAVSALYEYNEICRSIVSDDRLAYGGIPIDTKSIDYSGINSSRGKINLFLGRHAARILEKGTDRLYEAARRVMDAHPDLCTLDVVENIPYAEYVKRLRDADIVLDQLYSYTPATNALLAMAMGKVVISGGEPEYYDFIGEYDNRPIINAVPDDDEALFRSIEEAVLTPRSLIDRGIKSREFAIKHNDVDVVAKRFIDFWKSKLL